MIEYCYTSVTFYQVWSALGAMCKALDMKPSEDHTADFYSSKNQDTTTTPTSTNQQSQVHGGHPVLHIIILRSAFFRAA